MPISFDVAINAGFASSNTTVSAADVTVASTSNRYVYAGLMSRDFSAGTTHSSVTLESESLGQLGTTESWFFGLGGMSAWGLEGIGSGANRTLTGTVAATQNDVAVCGVVYNGVDQTTPERDNDQSSASGTASSYSPSLTLTTESGDRVAMVMVLQLETPDTITITVENEVVDSNNSDIHMVIVDKTATGTSTTINPTLTFDAGSNNYRVAYHAVALIPAAGGGGINAVAWIRA